VSDFFEFPDLPPEPRQSRPPEPPWFHSPRGVLPGAVPLELLLASNQRAAVAVTKLGAYPVGFDFEVLVIVRDGDDDLDPNVIGHFHRPRRSRLDAKQEMLRFGVQFADGGKVTNLPGPDGPRLRSRDDEPPPGPVLQQQGGGGGGGEWRQRFWVWPLPPPGPLVFACEWPVAGIELTLAEVDAQLVIDAAARSQQIFEPSGGPSGGSSISITSYGRPS
jgi:hypothetical protein